MSLMKTLAKVAIGGGCGQRANAMMNKNKIHLRPCHSGGGLGGSCLAVDQVATAPRRGRSGGGLQDMLGPGDGRFLGGQPAAV